MRIGNRTVSRLSGIFALGFALLMGCLGPDRTTGGSMEENEVLAGTIRLPNGLPVAGANVRVYSVDHVPGEAGSPVAYSTRTAADGSYSVDSLPKGEYNILGDNDGRVAFRDSVYLAAGARVVVSDTLRDPGTLSGVVALQPPDDPRSVVVQVLGTDHFANVDADGRFTLSGLAEGQYRLRVETTEPDYAPLFVEVEAAASEVRVLADTLYPPYTGVPIPVGLKASLDTAAGVVRFTWKPVRYRTLDSYLVYRDPATSTSSTRTLLGMTGDTAWTDTLFPAGSDYGLASGNFPAPVSHAYRVRVRNQSDLVGRSFGSAVVSAVPPSWVRTRILLASASLQSGEASRGDTIRVVAGFRNKTRSLTRVAWRLGGESAILRDRILPGRPFEESDTLTLVKDVLGQWNLECRVYDEAGDSASAQMQIRVVAAPPLANAGRDTVVWRGGRAALRGTAATRFGSAARLAWDVGATGSFQPAPDGTIAFTAPDTFAVVPCVLRATNDDGEQGFDTVRVRVEEVWEEVDDRLPFLGTYGKAVEFRGRLWMIGGRPGGNGRGNFFSTADGVTWREETPTQDVTTRHKHALLVFQDQLWILGGEDVNDGRDYGDIWSSPDGVDWTRRQQMPFQVDEGMPQGAVVFGDRIVAPLGLKGWSGTIFPRTFESEDGAQWTERVSSSMSTAIPRSVTSYAVFQGKLVQFGVQAGTLWDSDEGLNWKSFTIPGNLLSRFYASAIVYDGRLWALGGNANSEELNTSAYAVRDPWDWRQGPAFPRTVGAGNVAYVFQGALWVIYEGHLYRLR